MPDNVLGVRHIKRRVANLVCTGACECDRTLTVQASLRLQCFLEQPKKVNEKRPFLIIFSFGVIC